jgi:hypothetical protein
MVFVHRRLIVTLLLCLGLRLVPGFSDRLGGHFVVIFATVRGRGGRWRVELPAELLRVLEKLLWNWLCPDHLR